VNVNLNRLVVAGALLVAIGGVWALQGAGILGGSVMSDDRRWLGIGLALVLSGAALVYRGSSRSG
jgi:hypothetical protein